VAQNDKRLQSFDGASRNHAGRCRMEPQTRAVWAEPQVQPNRPRNGRSDVLPAALLHAVPAAHIGRILCRSMVRYDSRSLASLADHAHTIRCKVATADHPTDLHVLTGTASIPRPRTRRLRLLSAKALDFDGGVFAGLVDVARG